MHEYGLKYLEGYFSADSIENLRHIFHVLSIPSIPESLCVQLKAEYLTIISREKASGNTPCAVSPSGMHFIYCIFQDGRYILLNPWGVTSLYQNWIIYDGEMDVTNVQWMEEDHLVTMDVRYIVRNDIQKCICHFSNDPGTFVYMTESRKENQEFFFPGDRIAEEEP